MAQEQRHITRDSLFVMAGLRLPGREREHRVKVRNLSAGGLMAEGDLRVAIGTSVEVEVRNLGWVPGVVAWVQDNRFGIAFNDEIDPLAARAAAPAPEVAEFVPRRHRVLAPRDPRSVRKI